MNYYQKKINELRSEIYEEIVDEMKSNGTTEIEFVDIEGPYFVGEYGDDLADYQITQVYLTKEDALYVKAHNKWDGDFDLLTDKEAIALARKFSIYL